LECASPLALCGATALGKDLKAAQAAAYAAVEKIHFDGAHFRRDSRRSVELTLRDLFKRFAEVSYGLIPIALRL
jgi:hypothetical protein